MIQSPLADADNKPNLEFFLLPLVKTEASKVAINVQVCRIPCKYVTDFTYQQGRPLTLANTVAAVQEIKWDLYDRLNYCGA